MEQGGPSKMDGMTSDLIPPKNKEDSFRPSLAFVGEGSANVVFAATREHARCPPGFLLRLQKNGTQAHDYISQNVYYQTFIKPLFKEEQLVQQKVEFIAAYDGWDIVSEANNVLAQLDRTGNRRAEFLGARVAKTESVMLVEDMRSRGESDFALEFKPKWLCQSPSAPKSSSRCRNCARSVLNSLEKGKMLTTAPLCPLDLLLCRTDDDALNRVMQKFAPDLENPVVHEPLKRWFRTNTLLQRLANHQHNLDKRGPLYFDVEDNDVLRAMTLRDCACFLRISLGGNGIVEAKLGDLDLKNGLVKKGHWRSMEQMLLDKGCYTETEELRQYTRCSLGKI